MATAKLKLLIFFIQTYLISRKYGEDRLKWHPKSLAYSIDLGFSRLLCRNTPFYT